MNYQWALILSLIFFIGGLILGFYLATRWVDEGDDIEIIKPKAKRSSMLGLNIFKRKKKKNGMVN